jgi:hypothetical protein
LELAVSNPPESDTSWGYFRDNTHPLGLGFEGRVTEKSPNVICNLVWINSQPDQRKTSVQPTKLKEIFVLCKDDRAFEFAY